jgi:hypothetical protein
MPLRSNLRRQCDNGHPIFTNAWKSVDLKTVFKRCRELAWRNQFVSWSTYFNKLLFFNPVQL